MSLEITNEVQAHCSRIREFTYQLVWRPERHYVAGTQIEVRDYRLRTFVTWRFTRVEMDGADIIWRWKTRPSLSERLNNPGRILFRARLQYGVRQGDEFRIRMSAVPGVWAGINERLSVWTIDVGNNFRQDEPEAEPQREEGSGCELPVVAGPVERLSVYCRPMPGPDATIRACLVPEDRFGNPGRFEDEVPMSLQWRGKIWQQRVRESTVLSLPTPEAVQRLIVSVPASALGPRENIANGVRQHVSLVVTGNPVWPEPADGPRAAFGEFHWHTDFSGDGQRPIHEALRCARDYLNMDFAAPGDHNPRGEAWETTVQALEEFNDPDSFATFFGWEAGSDRGHENYYFTDPNHPLVCGGSAGVKGGRPDSNDEILREQQDFIAIPHHTNAVAETRKLEDDSPFWHPYPWGDPEEFRRLVEIFQVRGNQERNEYDDAWRGWHQNNRASVQDALAGGHKVGFTGGTDNHCGWPGRAFAMCEGLGNHPPKSVILTGVWTDRVERQSVYDSLRDRHTWAVWDTRAIVHFTVNGVLGGGELEVAKGDPLTAHLRMSVEDHLQTVEIVSEGEVVWASSFDKLDIDQEVQLGEAASDTHFYLRALQRNGGIIYASPVFVTVAQP